MTRCTQRRFFFGLVALALGGLAWANRRLFTINDVTTGESAAYPTLCSRVYYADPRTVLTAAAQSISALPRWHVVGVDEENMALDAEAKSPFGGFTDDVTLYFTPLGGGQTRVIVRSHSRAGRGDLGQNAAHIRALQKMMDDRLTRDAAF